MKKLFLIPGLLLSLCIVFQSCNMFPDPEEIDYQTELNLLLPHVQYVTGFFNGTDHNRFQLQWSQQLSGVRGVHLTVDRYNMLRTHTQEMWDVYYNTTFPNLSIIIQYANEIEAPAYRGLAKVLYVLNLGLMTDAFGDIPNQSAMNYHQGLPVTYDNQGDIYQHMVEQIDLAITDLNKAISDNSPKPGAQHDLIYGGDLRQWIKAANAIKLKYLMRMAHYNNEYQLVRLNINPANLFTGNQDDMEYVFYGNQQNLFFHYDNIVNNTRLGKFFVDLLIGNNDPRLPVFVKRRTSDNQYVGSAPGAALLNASFIGTKLASQYSPAMLMTYVEQKFIEAEVLLRAGEQSAADLAFESAVKASLQKFGVSNAAWEATHASIENVSLEQIITAKYVALFLNPEVWSDYRRTGFPQLTPYQNAETPQIPRRFLYPEREATQNTQNMPADVTVYTRMWWDVER